MLLNQDDAGASAAFDLADDGSLCTQLYRCYAAGVLAYLQRHLPTQEDAEDLLLEVFLAALEYEARLAVLSEGERKAWLLIVARNKRIDYYRRASRRSFFTLEKAEATPDSKEKTPEEVLMRAEEYERLRLYLQQLSKMQQEVLQLRFAAGLRCTEIASVLHKQEGAIRTIISRALNTLRGFYEQRNKGER